MIKWFPPLLSRRAIYLLLVVLVATLSPCLCFNLETKAFKLFTDPLINERARESYFGFAVALQLSTDDTAWLVVGAPRANSSYYVHTQIKEPGAVFKCNLATQECEELLIDRSGNNVSQNQNSQFQYQDLKNGGWLGAVLDSQPVFESGRQATGVCAPRWRNQLYHQTYLMNGACYWLNSSLPHAAHKKLPLLQFSKQTYTISGRSLFYYSHGEAGLSLHFPDEPTEMIVGAPGVFNWQGTVIRFKDFGAPVPGEIARRRRRRQSQISEHQMFTDELVPNPYYTSKIEDFDLMGYAVTSGRFISSDELLYAGGAPRGAFSRGKVLVFAFTENEFQPLDVRAEWQGTQMGEKFGAALTAADINGDGLSDLLVGSPMYSLPDIPDMGQIQVYLSFRGKEPQKSNIGYYGSRTGYARFGTTLASVGDLNADNFEDVVVGAPWEGDGAVYVYLGSPNGLRQDYSQRIAPEDFQQSLSGFGMAISRGIDIDNNDYPDLAIGSFMSGHAVVVHSRPVATLTGHIIATPSTLALEDRSFELSACIEYQGHKVPRNVYVKGNISLDSGFSSPRAFFTDSNTYVMEFEETAIIGQVECKIYRATVKEDKVDPRQPLLLKMEYELSETPGNAIITQPITDPGMPKSVASRVSIVTGCEKDGDETCRVDMHLETKFLKYGDTKKLVIGEDNKPVMEVAVFNSGEPVFLPNMTVNVVPPLALFLPTSHDCEFPNVENRTSLVCRLANPIGTAAKDTVEVVVDASQLMDTSRNVAVDVVVSGEGQEIRPKDNTFSQKLQLLARANLKLHGYSKDEQILYKRLEEDKINVTSSPSFFHQFTLLKSGPTPLGQVELLIKIPFNFTRNNVNFVKIFPPKASFLGQPVLCNLIDATFTVESRDEVDGSDASVILNVAESANSTTFLPEPPSSRDGLVTKTEASVEPQDFNCSNSLIKCAQLQCLINSWPGDTSSAEISFKLEVDLAVLAGYISARAGAVFKTTATATIRTLNADLAFSGEKTSNVIVQTQIQPDTLPGRGVPWWVILLAVLGGLLLLGLLAYGLYKAGFFTRKEQEEMKAQQARVASADSYGTANTGLVGD